MIVLLISISVISEILYRELIQIQSKNDPKIILSNYKQLNNTQLKNDPKIILSNYKQSKITSKFLVSQIQSNYNQNKKTAKF